MSRPVRAWGEWGMRALFSVLLFAVGFQLLAQSTFAWRLREDVAVGTGGAVAIVAAILALLPLLAGRRFLGAYLFAGLVLAALGAYWWTTIPWEEVVTETNFTIAEPARLQDYALVAAPMFLGVAFAALSRWSRVRADLLERGAERAQAMRAAATSFLVGVVSLLAAGAAGAAFIGLLASGALRQAPALIEGAPAAVLAVLIVGGLVAMLGRQRLRRPSSPEGGREDPARSPARRWPS